MFCFCLQVIFLDYSIYIYVYSITYYTWHFVIKYHLKTCQSLWILCQTEEHESALGFEPRRARFHLTSAACLTTTLPVLACYGCIHSHTLFWHVQCNQFHFLKMNITAKLLNHEWIRKMKSVGWIFTFIYVILELLHLCILVTKWWYFISCLFVLMYPTVEINYRITALRTVLSFLKNHL